MRIFLECPNCNNKYDKRLDGALTPNNVKEAMFTTTYCPECLKNNLGKIELRVKQFDWERTSATTNSTNVPTKLDPSEFDENQLDELRRKELAKLSTE